MVASSSHRFILGRGEDPHAVPLSTQRFTHPEQADPEPAPHRRADEAADELEVRVAQVDRDRRRIVRMDAHRARVLDEPALDAVAIFGRDLALDHEI